MRKRAPNRFVVEGLLEERSVGECGMKDGVSAGFGGVGAQVKRGACQGRHMLAKRTCRYGDERERKW